MHLERISHTCMVCFQKKELKGEGKRKACLPACLQGRRRNRRGRRIYMDGVDPRAIREAFVSSALFRHAASGGGYGRNECSMPKRFRETATNRSRAVHK
jgi:hypothetical protein